MKYLHFIWLKGLTSMKKRNDAGVILIQDFEKSSTPVLKYLCSKVIWLFYTQYCFIRNALISKETTQILSNFK